MAPLRGEKKMPSAIATTTGLTSTETPMLRPRRAIIVYNERQLQVRANDERKLLNNSTNGRTNNVIVEELIVSNEDKKSFNRKRRSSTESAIELIKVCKQNKKF